MTESEIAGYISYWYQAALSQVRKVAFFLGENSIGRDGSNRVVIPEATVSKLHAKLVVSAARMQYMDLSKNGTKMYTNSEDNRMAPRTLIDIYDRDLLFLGDVACRFERLPQKYSEETITVIRPADKAAKAEKERRNIIMEMICASQSEEEIKASLANNQEEKPSPNQQPALEAKNEADEFSLTGDFYNGQKKEQNKSKKEKQTKKINKTSKEEKQQPAEANSKQEDNAKNKKKQKRMSAQRPKIEKQEKKEGSKDKQKKIEQKFIIKQSKEEASPQRNSKKSKEKEELKKKQQEKQQRLKKEKEKQQQKKREKEERKRKEKQQQQLREKQEAQRRQQQERQRRAKEEKAKKKENADKSKSRQLKRNSKERETGAQELNESKRNLRKPNANQSQGTKRRVSRKRLPSNGSSIDAELYPPRRSFVNRRVLFSGFIPDLTRKYFCIVESVDEQFDYLVMKEYKRTFKALYAICKGIPILRYDWIRESEFLEKTLKPEGYIFKEMDVVYRSIDKVNSGLRVFQGLQFFLGSEEYHLRIEDIEALIYAGGGEVMKKIGKMSPKEKEGKNKIAIIRNLQESVKKSYEEELKSIKKLGFDEIYTIEMILDSCQRQEIDWEHNKVK